MDQSDQSDRGWTSEPSWSGRTNQVSSTPAAPHCSDQLDWSGRWSGAAFIDFSHRHDFVGTSRVVLKGKRTMTSKQAHAIASIFKRPHNAHFMILMKLEQHYVSERKQSHRGVSREAKAIHVAHVIEQTCQQQSFLSTRYAFPLPRS